MPTIQEIADEINAALGQLNTTASNIRGDTQAIRTEVSEIDNHLQAGVGVLAEGLFAILEAQKQGNSIGEHQIQQNDTIICWLDNIAELLCGMTRKMTRQIELQEQIAGSVARVEGIAELVHPGEVAEYDRNKELERRIEECCPPPEEPPEPCPEACRTPEPDLYKPKGQSWKPPKPPKEKPPG